MKKNIINAIVIGILVALVLVLALSTIYLYEENQDNLQRLYTAVNKSELYLQQRNNATYDLEKSWADIDDLVDKLEYYTGEYHDWSQFEDEPRIEMTANGQLYTTHNYLIYRSIRGNVRWDTDYDAYRSNLINQSSDYELVEGEIKRK